jgi:predicted ATP-grasp superfamily ATP-dependent carboligase
LKPIIIIGFAEALSAPEVAWSLLDHGFEVLAFSRRGHHAALQSSRFVRMFHITSPESDIKAAETELKEMISSLRLSSGSVLVMPLDDQALWLCGRCGSIHETHLVGPQGKALEAALDKRRQFELARESDFLVPICQFVDTRSDLLHTDVPFPMVFKPALAASATADKLSKGQAWICANAYELENAVKRWSGNGPMILQHFVQGTGEGVFGLRTDEGVTAWSSHRRVRMMNPHGSGASACTPIANISQEIKAACEKFLKNCDWRGLFMIELLRDSSGKLWFIEFNGRPWGSMALARRQGFEYPAWSAQLKLNPKAVLLVPQGPTHINLCRHLGREMVHLLFVLRGAKTTALKQWPSIGKTIRDIFKIGKNDCLYNWRKNDSKVFISDCLGTVWDQMARKRAKR